MHLLRAQRDHPEFQQYEWQSSHPSSCGDESACRLIACAHLGAQQTGWSWRALKSLQVTPAATAVRGTPPPGSLSLRHILSVRCPMCGAAPKAKCTLSTGHPSAKTHLVRDQAAAKVVPTRTSGLAALRMLMAVTSRSFRVIFQNK